MLIVDYNKRIRGMDALKHPWFQKYGSKGGFVGSDEDKLDKNILNNLRQYRGVSTLKKAVMNILVKMADGKDIEHIREQFMRVDKDGTGYIKANELKQALTAAKIPFREEEIDKIISEVDYGGQNRMINYTEFLAAGITVKKILTEDKLKAIFKQFDTDGTGKITATNIAEAMKKLGHTVTGAEVRDIMGKHDIKKDGFISFDEFRQIFYEQLNPN